MDYAWQVPGVNFTHAADLVMWCAGRYSIGKEELFAMCCAVGRNSGPMLMWELHEFGQLEANAYRLAGVVWSSAEYPENALDRSEWRTLFQSAGFTIDGVPAPRPAEPLRLWRGSVPERRANWSWTSSREIAVDYARGIARRPNGNLWTAQVEPWRIFCRNEESRKEFEYVVDTDGLDIKEAPIG